MRKRFWVSMIICILAAFSLLTLVAISDQARDGAVFASAKVTGISR